MGIFDKPDRLFDEDDEATLVPDDRVFPTLKHHEILSFLMMYRMSPTMGRRESTEEELIVVLMGPVEGAIVDTPISGR